MFLAQGQDAVLAPSRRATAGPICDTDIITYRRSTVRDGGKSDTIDHMADFHTWLSAVLAKPELASWLQAFAAIVALVISVWATWRVGAAERRRSRLQAHGIAVAIYPELLKRERPVVC
jgi:hypothetical protein